MRGKSWKVLLEAILLILSNMVQLNDFEKVVFCFGNIDLFNGYEKYCKWQLIFVLDTASLSLQ